MQTYLSETPKLLATLHTAVTLDEASTIERTAHSLKSSSATMGALRLASLCAELEALGRANCTGNAAVLLAQIVTTYEAVREALTGEVQGQTILRPLC